MVGVFGAGKWGSALAFALSFKQNVKISSKTTRELNNFTTLEDVLECQYLIVAISSQEIKSWFQNSFKFKNQKILIASKGIDVKEGKFLNQIIEEFVPKENLAFLSGPSFAKEVMQGLPTALVVSSTNLELAKEFSTLFPKFIKCYSDDDVIGAEICGAYKNVLAIASGICDGLELGNNARASLIARGLVEMERFGLFFGAKVDTFLGLSGAGDLFLTASSNLSRNYRVGFKLAKREKLENILQEIGEVAEGVVTAKAIKKISEREKIYTPIVNEVYNILNGKEPQDSLSDLLQK